MPPQNDDFDDNDELDDVDEYGNIKDLIDYDYEPSTLYKKSIKNKNKKIKKSEKNMSNMLEQNYDECYE